MNKRVKFGALVLAIIVLSAGFSLASFSYKNNNIRTSYSAGERISGTLNISFSSEFADSRLTSNFNGSIKLIELLRANQLTEKVDYSCTYPGCVDSYITLGSAAGGMSLSSGSPGFVGFKINGEEIEVTSLKFSVASSANKSCSRQLLIDVLDKNESFVHSMKNTGIACGSESFGCYSEANTNPIFADISTEFYCEKINLPVAAAFKLGAIVKNVTDSDTPGDLKMNLQNLNGEVLDECILPKHSTTVEQLGCIVNYSVSSSRDYFICISAVDSGDPDSDRYQIKTEEKSPMCGTSTGGEPYNIDFSIFAKPVEFAAVGTLDVTGALFEELNFELGSSLAEYVNSYLNAVYQRNCSGGCIIPFKLAGISQGVTFSNAQIKFKKGATPNIERSDENFYKFEKDKVKVTTLKPINLEMSHAGFTIPLGSNASRFYLYLNNISVLPVPINISISPSFGFDILPKTVLVGAKTNFQAITSADIIASTWNFGDGGTKTSSGKTASHRYMMGSQNSYVVEVELTRNDGVKARNSFVVNVGSLRTSAEGLVAEYESRIGNLSSQINALTPFAANNIKNKFNITGMQASIAAVRRSLGNASSDSDYSEIINDALAINPPASIGISEEGKSIPLSFGLENIDVRYIEQISETTLGSDSARSDLKKAISGWLESNYDAKLDYNVISETNDNDEKVPILTDFKVSLVKKPGADESADQAYLIINYPRESINFLGNYSDRTVGSGAYISVEDSKNIEFILSGSVGISSLGLYLSPQISQLISAEGAPFAEKGGFNWGRFVFWIFVLLIVAFAVYIALQEWYKRRYESYLFKNPVDLYNIITFIHNSRKNGLNDIEIAKKLKNAGWKGEQITYAFNKLDGKRTGMYEIPIFRFLEQRKIKEEIEMRRIQQQAPQESSAAKTAQQP